MELITPGPGLLAWQVILFVNMVLILIALSWILIIKMREKELTPKLLMMLLTLIVPIAGAVACLVLVNNHNKQLRHKA
jgi:hypothetical protein